MHSKLTISLFTIALLASTYCQGQEEPDFAKEVRTLALPLVARDPANQLGNIRLAFSPDSATVAAATHWINTRTDIDSGEINFWDEFTGRHIATFRELMDVQFIAPSQFAAIDLEGNVKFVELKTRREKTVLRAMSERILVSPNGALLAAISASPTEEGRGVIHLINTMNGEVLGRIDQMPFATAFSPAGTEFYTVSKDRERGFVLHIWDTHTERGAVPGKRISEHPLRGHRETVDWLVIGTKRIASAGIEILLWKDPATSQKLGGEPNMVTSLAMTKDDNTLVATTWSEGTKGILWPWDATTGRPKKPIRGHESTILALAMSPDGALMASGDEKNTIKIWKLTSPRPVEPTTSLLNIFVEDKETKTAFDTARLSIRTATGEPVNAPLMKRDSLYLYRLGPGNYVVIAEMEGYETAAKEVTIGTEAAGITIPLQKKVARPPVAVTKRLSIEVSGAGGAPLADATVLIDGIADPKIRMNNGRYEVSLPQGKEYRVTVQHPKHQSVTKAVLVSDVDMTMSIKLSANPSPPDPKLFALQLTIFDEAKKSLLKGAAVGIESEGKPLKAESLSTEDGIFIYRLKPGEYKVTVQREAFEPKSVDITLDEEISAVSVYLAKTPPIAYELLIRVLDENKKSLEDLKVEVDPGIELLPDREGTDYWCRLLPGEYEATVAFEGKKFGTNQFTMGEENAEIVVEKAVEEIEVFEVAQDVTINLDADSDGSIGPDDFSPLGWATLKQLIGKVDDIALTEEELSEWLQSQIEIQGELEVQTETPNPNPEDATAQILGELDQDGSGTLTSDDFSPLGWEVFRRQLGDSKAKRFNEEELTTHFEQASNKASGVRNWQSAAGNNTVSATYIRSEKDMVTLLRASDNREVTLRLDLLSEKDQAFVRSQESRVEQPKDAAEMSQELFATLDSNGDSVVDEKDFSETGWRHIKLRFDQDGDNQLSASELKDEIGSEPTGETPLPPANLKSGILTIRKVTPRE